MWYVLLKFINSVAQHWLTVPPGGAKYVNFLEIGNLSVPPSRTEQPIAIKFSDLLDIYML